MKKNTLLIIGGVIVAYYLWKKSQETTETVIVEGEAMSRAIGTTIGRKGKPKYGASACQHPTNKIYTVCGQSCPNGHTKLSGAHMYGC
tara:strand:+ start:168 stop:431 length:264 start_codon:yes stop_codon:yes gene_type:complete